VSIPRRNAVVVETHLLVQTQSLFAIGFSIHSELAARRKLAKSGGF